MDTRLPLLPLPQFRGLPLIVGEHRDLLPQTKPQTGNSIRLKPFVNSGIRVPPPRPIPGKETTKVASFFFVFVYDNSIKTRA
jgi:hypothetical protein